MKLKLSMKGVTPLLMHNERLADPLNPYTQKLASVTGKRKKTIEDHEEIARLEFEGGIYWSEELGPFAPSRWVSACLAEAGTVDRKGTAIQRGLQVLTFEAPLDYAARKEDVVQTVEQLWESGQFHYRATVGLGAGKAKKRTTRTRAMFMPWAASVDILIDGSILDFEQVARTAEIAGRLYGLGDGRRLGYGRFEALLEDEDVMRL